MNWMRRKWRSEGGIAIEKRVKRRAVCYHRHLNCLKRFVAKLGTHFVPLPPSSTHLNPIFLLFLFSGSFLWAASIHELSLVLSSRYDENTNSRRRTMTFRKSTIFMAQTIRFAFATKPLPFPLALSFVLCSSTQYLSVKKRNGILLIYFYSSLFSIFIYCQIVLLVLYGFVLKFV